MNDEGLTGALTISEFCADYNIGRTFAYGEIRSGRLTAIKAGSKTLIRVSDAERWLRSLPRLRPNHQHGNRDHDSRDHDPKE